MSLIIFTLGLMLFLMVVSMVGVVTLNGRTLAEQPGSCGTIIGSVAITLLTGGFFIQMCLTWKPAITSGSKTVVFSHDLLLTIALALVAYTALVAVSTARVRTSTVQEAVISFAIQLAPLAIIGNVVINGYSEIGLPFKIAQYWSLAGFLIAPTLILLVIEILLKSNFLKKEGLLRVGLLRFNLAMFGGIALICDIQLAAFSYVGTPIPLMTAMNSFIGVLERVHFMAAALVLLLVLGTIVAVDYCRENYKVTLAQALVKGYGVLVDDAPVMAADIDFSKYDVEIDTKHKVVNCTLKEVTSKDK